jgi:cobyrinic acid a,c-diamide synthase
VISRLVVAGAASGVGKTTVMVAMTAALRARGLRVATFKCGPDYLDPTYHSRASGAPSHNLDGWMMGRDAVLATFARQTRDADIALIEGMMGLHDGRTAGSDEASAAQLAKWLRAPVVVVIDASAMARTFAAVAEGLRGFDREVDVAGAFANRVGSRAHAELLQRASAGHVPLVGALPADASHAFTERHLGLVAADPTRVPEATVAAWARTFAEWNDVDALVALAARAPALDLPSTPAPAHPPRCRIAVARDAAFHFYYDDNLERLVAAGAELVWFSPLADARVPACDGVYLGGGYPEVHAAALAANEPMRASLRAAAAAGVPIYAECGGLMYLCDAIRTRDGEHAMLGLVAGTAVVRDRLQALGYVEVETAAPTLFGARGVKLRGHQFRYSTLEGAHPNGAYGGVDSFGDGNVLGSWVHVHWASNPAAADAFVARCGAR